MLRLLQLIAILVPLGIYVAYVWNRRRVARASGDTTPDWYQSGPALWCLGGGVAIMMVILITWTMNTGAPPGSDYVAPYTDHGRPVDAEFIPPDDP